MINAYEALLKLEYSTGGERNAWGNSAVLVVEE